MLILSVLLYAFEICTLFTIGVKVVKCCKMSAKYLQIWWHNFIRNTELPVWGFTTCRTGTCRTFSPVLGHVTGLSYVTPNPVHHIRLSLGWFRDETWQRQPSHLYGHISCVMTTASSSLETSLLFGRVKAVVQTVSLLARMTFSSLITHTWAHSVLFIFFCHINPPLGGSNSSINHSL